jgi:3-deoxy-7-phosphoheptulonate synthase
VIRTQGNPFCHVVLRGGRSGSNFHNEAIAQASRTLRAAKLMERVMVDCSHANSGKDHNNQPRVIDDLCTQLRRGEQPILGVMLESNLVAGRQDLTETPHTLRYGQSITDACIDFATTEQLLERLASAARQPSRKPRSTVSVAPPAV